MPRNAARSMAVATLLALCLGCAHPNANQPEPSPSVAIDYAQQRYADTAFVHPTLVGQAQAARFRQDIDACDRSAQKRYQNALENAAKLQQIYGQRLTPEALQQIKQTEVTWCMAGDPRARTTGKGWRLR
ncbi:hypothetical protein [Pseudomonas sp. nanlin1]|uniref:hypothetical protein n=1 Tax=Pseudomonas sp. nanlin1 TaxID=3040605 RepID=UPI0038909407